jgi:hypothetical protein
MFPRFISSTAKSHVNRQESRVDSQQTLDNGLILNLLRQDVSITLYFAHMRINVRKNMDIGQVPESKKTTRHRQDRLYTSYDKY